MKKVLSILLIAALLVSLSACTGSDNGPAAEAAAPEEQIALMAANKDLWLDTESVYTPFYAVTDLDGDGFLELIRDIPGDDWSNVVTFFEVGKDGKSLKELAFPFGDEHSHPDLADQDAFRMYVGQEGRYLIAKDDIYMGPVQASSYQAYHVLDYLLLGADGVEAGDLAWCRMQDEDTNGDGLNEYHIYYYTGDASENAGDTLDGQGYVNAPAERFAGYEEQVCKVAWWALDEDTEPDEEALTTGLSYSWQGFSVEPDAELFASLVEDPYYSVYAAGAGGSPIYRVDETVPEFPSFPEIRGTWYLQYAWTDEAIWYVGTGLADGDLTILDGGLLYANYYNEYDERGAYLFTGMQMTRDSMADGSAMDDWVIYYTSDDDRWEMQLRPDPSRQLMYVTWYEWEDGSRTGEPRGVNLVYSRIAG